MELLRLQIQLLDLRIQQKIRDAQRVGGPAPLKFAGPAGHNEEVAYLVRDLHTISEDDAGDSRIQQRIARKFVRLHGQRAEGAP